MYYREIATKSGHKIFAKHRGFNCAVLPYTYYKKENKNMKVAVIGAGREDKEAPTKEEWKQED